MIYSDEKLLEIYMLIYCGIIHLNQCLNQYVQMVKMVCDSTELRYRKTKCCNCSISATHYIVIGPFMNFRNFYIFNVCADRYLKQSSYEWDCQGIVG